MAGSLERWLNGLVYSLFGPDVLALFQAHPWVYALLALGIATILAGLAGSWGVGRFLHWCRSSITFLRLAASQTGRHCLRQGRAIRRGAARIRRSVRHGLEDKAERRALLKALQGFSNEDMGIVLEQALRLIQRSNDKLERTLRAEMERRMETWSRLEEGGEREAQLRAIAEIRHRLEQVAQANRQRDQWIAGLDEGALAIAHLEGELAGLRLVRERNPAAFRAQLTQAAENLGHLKQAHLELNRLLDP